MKNIITAKQANILKLLGVEQISEEYYCYYDEEDFIKNKENPNYTVTIPKRLADKKDILVSAFTEKELLYMLSIFDNVHISLSDRTTFIVYHKNGTPDSTLIESNHLPTVLVKSLALYIKDKNNLSVLNEYLKQNIIL